MLLGKGVLKICSKFTGEHICGSVISISFHILDTSTILENGTFSQFISIYYSKPYHCFQMYIESLVMNYSWISENILFTLLGSSRREVFYKKVFLEMLQNSQESTCARASFLIKLQA